MANATPGPAEPQSAPKRKLLAALLGCIPAVGLARLPTPATLALAPTEMVPIAETAAGRPPAVDLVPAEAWSAQASSIREPHPWKQGCEIAIYDGCTVYVIARGLDKPSAIGAIEMGGEAPFAMVVNRRTQRPSEIDPKEAYCVPEAALQPMSPGGIHVAY